MAQRLDVPPPHPFSMSSSRSSSAWSKWMRSFSYYIGAAGITQAAQKKSLLLHIAGPDVQELFDTLTVGSPTDEQNEYDVALAALTSYFAPAANIAFERHLFRQANQGQDESVDDFCTRLKGLASSCSFDNRDEHVRDQFVDKCASSSLRRRLLRERDLTLTTLLDIARASEAAASQADEMEGKLAHEYASKVTANPGRSRGERRPRGPPRGPPPPRTSPGGELCGNCGRTGHRSRDSDCPARGQTCNKCRKVGHFGRVCRSSKFRQPRTRSTPVHTVNDEDRHSEGPNDRLTDEECNFEVHTAQTVLTRTDIDIGGHNIPMIIDSGASVNIVDSTVWDWMRGRDRRLRFTPSHRKIFGYGSKQQLPVLGEFTSKMTSVDTKKSTHAKIVIVDGNGGCLLSRETSITLGLLTIHPDLNNIKSQTPTQDTYRQDIITKYPAVFNGFGKLVDYQVHVQVDHEVKPVAQPPRRIPFHLRKKVEGKIEELLDKDIIEPISGPTSWASPLVVVPKSNGEVRVCVDMRRANTAVVRERHPIPTLEETLEALNGAAVFSKLDLKWGYHQVELDDESRDITTFVTHKGLMRYKRLIFGLSSASEIYQYAIQQALSGLEGVRNISDDIIVFGKDDKEHDHRLHAVIKRLQEKNLTLNAEKCVFRTPSLTFFGFKISRDGVSAEDAKVNAIRQAKTPSNVQEVRSFLGLVNYCARLIENLASIAEPLRELTRGDTQWKWETRHQRSFDELRNALTSDKVIAHFVTGADTQLRVDASPVGLGAILTQTVNGITRPVAYASRTLSDVERRYSQTEKEALAVVWGCERFHMYLIGTEFDLLTDHKPLQFMYSPTGKPPARVERWVLRMQPYKYRIKHVPGKGNPADPLSRLPVVNAPNRERDIAEDYIDAILSYAVPRAMTRSEIANATSNDTELQRVMASIRSNSWSKDDMMSTFYKVRHELSVKRGVLLRDHRVVIPRSLRQRTMNIAHEAHKGIVRLKQALRTKVWWPHIDDDAENAVRHCPACQVESAPPRKETICPTEMPKQPWHTLHIDLCGPLPNGKSLLVVVDNASRWPEVEIITSTTTESIINRLRRIFATHGVPNTIVSDNGPQFVSAEFKEYLRDNGIDHRRVAPYHPQANATVERFNATVLRALRRARQEGRELNEALQSFLLVYRTTPHAATKATPARLLCNREFRTKMPSVSKSKMSKEFRKARKADSAYKNKMSDADKAKSKRNTSAINIGDQVIILRPRPNKMAPRYDPRPWKVVKIKGNCVEITRNNQSTMRHLSKVKRYHGHDEHLRDNDVGSDIEDDHVPPQSHLNDNSSSTAPRRSTRERREPSRLNYYGRGNPLV
ncbi:uncharacterized protein K02A2.6-like [Lytechinus variegatus]|uniref:uncharacterized protein K02A2.6-like n=1 Tax=Lytechinus variegatus TaxID=7654 RepID=UPI001BB1470C|nr:uncharacterized protein K02A2.6-like [Lytechinus variegatus]